MRLRVALVMIFTLFALGAVQSPASAHVQAEEPKATATSGPSAALDDYPCQSGGWVCLFDASRCCGQDPYRYVIVDNYPAGFCFNIPTEWDNRVDSVTNRTSHVVRFWTGNFCSGDPLDPHNFWTLRWTEFQPYDQNEANSMMFL